MVWYSHLLKNFPQFVVIYSVSGFGVINKAEVNVFLELSCFLYDPADVDNLISDSSAFSKSSLNISLIAQLVKNPSAMQETLIRFLSWEDLLEKG